MTSWSRTTILLGHLLVTRKRNFSFIQSLCCICMLTNTFIFCSPTDLGSSDTRKGTQGNKPRGFPSSFPGGQRAAKGITGSRHDWLLSLGSQSLAPVILIDKQKPPCPPAECVHAKSLQLCLTLCHPLDCSPAWSSVQGILQAGILECVSMPSSGDLPDPGIEPLSLGSPALVGGF